jgi:hypothetical protein
MAPVMVMLRIGFTMPLYAPPAAGDFVPSVAHAASASSDLRAGPRASL